MPYTAILTTLLKLHSKTSTPFYKTEYERLISLQEAAITASLKSKFSPRVDNVPVGSGSGSLVIGNSLNPYDISPHTHNNSSNRERYIPPPPPHLDIDR